MIKVILCFALLITVITGESGKCSWYGGSFNGHKTACGEIFNENEMTAASNTIPCNTMVHVTANGHTITVKVTDTGKFGPGVIMDLSKGAAAKLGIVSEGVAPCTVTRA